MVNFLTLRMLSKHVRKTKTALPCTMWDVGMVGYIISALTKKAYCLIPTFHVFMRKSLSVNIIKILAVDLHDKIIVNIISYMHMFPNQML